MEPIKEQDSTIKLDLAICCDSDVLVEQINMQHSRHMRLSALVEYQLQYPDMTIREFFSMAAEDLREQDEDEEEEDYD